MSAPAFDTRTVPDLRCADSPRIAATDLFLGWLGFVLIGYALGGRGFAYFGVGPLYIGELTLLAGFLAILASRTPLRLPRGTAPACLSLWMGLCAARTLLDVGRFGVDALRDAALWGYALFVPLLFATLLARPSRLAWLVARYERFLPAFALLIPAVWLVSIAWGPILPRHAGTDVALLQPKPGDLLVHLAGATAFLIASPRHPSLLWPLVLAPAVGLTAVRTRGGLLAFVLALIAVAVARPRSRRLWLGAAAALLAGTLVLASGGDRSVAGRALSLRQLGTSVTSIFQEVDSSNLDGPRRWRLRWWAEIVDYTVFGPHFWLGKGFGLNLASDDGFDVDPERRLRSPHNSHLTILARTGVPGGTLWILLQAAWLRQMVRQHRSSRRLGQRNWSRLFLCLVAYWLAFLVNAAFDVSLEGPMVGIWFWTVFGVGLAAVHLREHRPELLEPGEAT